MNFIQSAIAYVRGHTIDAAISGVTKAIARLEAVVQRAEANVIAHEQAIVAAVKAKDEAIEQRIKASRLATNFRKLVA